MEDDPPNPNPITDDPPFFDTLDDFDSFFDCPEPPIQTEEEKDPPVAIGLRRRRSVKKVEILGSNSDESLDFFEGESHRKRRNEILGELKQCETVKEEALGEKVEERAESGVVEDNESHRKRRNEILGELKQCETVKEEALGEKVEERAESGVFEDNESHRKRRNEILSELKQCERVKEEALGEKVEERAESGVVEDNESDNTKSTANSGVFQGVSPRKRRSKIMSALKECERSKEEALRETTQATESSSRDSVANRSEELDDSSFLVYLAGLVIKAISFQASLLFNFFSFPIWVSYFSVMFMIHPYGTLKQVKNGVLKRFNGVWRVFSERVAPFLFEKVKGQKTVANLVLKFGWGFVCSVYICFVLFGFLASGFIGGGVLMRYLVEEPVRMMEPLSFDYTRSSPVALVPIISCPAVFSGVRYLDDVAKTKANRVLPPNQKLQLTISLTVPESDYNRQLGVFQVRVDFLSENGEATASSRLPCMLRFKSHIIRYLETFLKSVPLLAGYASEAQHLKVKMRGFTEGNKPTSCLRVILEQRAEYRTGAGIPEIYTASLLLESELPLFKRILWYWKKTIYVWISLVLFTMELMLGLLCCRPVLLPRARLRESSTTSDAPQSSVSSTVSS